MSTSRKILLALLFVVVTALPSLADEGDKELLRTAHSTPRTPTTKEVVYGIEPECETFSPLYHVTSSALWLWESYIAPEVCAPGGYTDSNTDYFKSLWREYGPLRALLFGFDRLTRNTKIGRVTTPTNPQGLIEDNPQRYRQ